MFFCCLEIQDGGHSFNIGPYRKYSKTSLYHHHLTSNILTLLKGFYDRFRETYNETKGKNWKLGHSKTDVMRGDECNEGHYYKVSLYLKMFFSETRKPI